VPPPGQDHSPSPLLHPIAIGALALLVVNDHLLKAAWPGLVTGKASDVAGLVLVPLLSVEFARLLAGGRLSPVARTRVAAAATLLIAATFVAVKLDPVANEAYAILLGSLQWPGALVGNMLAGASLATPGRAPTVLDPGDLIALPAAAVGWWVAAGNGSRRAGRWRPGPRLQTAGRIAMLLGAVVALAATSPMPRPHVTAVARDEVILAPGDPPVHRRLTIRIAPGRTPATAGSPIRIDIQARPTWPLVDPPARFVLARVGDDGELDPSTGSSLSVDPAVCGAECTIEADVAIDWPAASGRPSSSIAWELAATIASDSQYNSVSGSVDISADGLHDTIGVSNSWWLALLVVIPFLAIAFADRLGRWLQIGTRAVRSAGDALVLAAASLLAAGLFAVPFLVPASALEPAAGGIAQGAVLLGPALGASIAVALVRWWSGEGDLLGIVVLGGLLAGLLFGVRLFGQASETFLARGLQIAALATLLAGVTLVGALGRLGGRDGEPPTGPVSTSRVVIAGIEVALIVGLAPINSLASLLLAIGLFLWWQGSGHLLGLASLVLGGAFLGLLFLGGPDIIGGPRWTPVEALSILLGGWAALIGLVVALGVGARHPDKPAPTAGSPPTHEPAPNSGGDPPVA
jgi:hypothetical protein